MISSKTIKTLEFDKILASISSFAVLNRTKNFIKNYSPSSSFKEIVFLLNKTAEAYKLLYTHSVPGIYYFGDISSELDRVDKNGSLNNGELLKVAQNLKSSRILKSSIDSISDEQIVLLKEISNRLYFDLDFEKEITSKIISEEEVSDNASQGLYNIRKSIRSINAKIREKLNSYIHGGLNKYLQDAVITIRQDRYVLPVKTEYRSFVKGFIHDQSSSGATVFIEPEQIIEYNNDLKRALIEEQVEIKKILLDLSQKVSSISSYLRYNAENIIEIDESYAKAQYSFINKCTKPNVNQEGYVNIVRGRHPLIAKEKVVPVTVSLGKDYNFLLVTGPNTGGKTVTLKLVGLLTLMAMSGVFIPAYDDSSISIFNDVFCDIGDEQSIEQNLSTFSSHVTNLINILENVDNNSLVLIDEIGAGTDPEEGSALAIAIIEKLLSLNCFGIITTHYSRLKEFAMETGKILNASMEFNPQSLKPVYKLNIGIPGSSNAIKIAKTLGLNSEIIDRAFYYTSENKVSFEKVLESAEECRRQTEKLNEELLLLKREKERELAEVIANREAITKEKEKIFAQAKQEVKRIVADKIGEAEEIVDELKSILKISNLSNKDVFKASELKNKLKNSKYISNEEQLLPIELRPCSINDIKLNYKVFVKSLNSYAIISSVKNQKKEAEILIGNIKSVVKFNDLFNAEPVKTVEKVKLSRNYSNEKVETSLNVIGQDSLEAIDNVKSFIDKAIVNGLEEIKIIHGVGEGILLKCIRDFLKGEKNVVEFRKGKYGEGENGVTIVKLR